MAASLQRGVPTALLPAATTTGTGVAVVVPTSLLNCRVHMRGTGAIGAGTLIIEEASDPAFAGTWSQLISVNCVTLAAGVEQVLHIAGGLGAIRARISVNVTVGSIAVDIVGN